MKKKGGVAVTDNSGSELIRPMPLYQRYMDIDYPQSLDDEVKLVKDKYQKLTGEGGVEMDFDDLENMDLGDDNDNNVVVPKPKKTAATATKKKEQETVRFTPGRGFAHAVRIFIYAVCCKENPKYNPLTRDIPEFEDICTHQKIHNQFDTHMKKQKQDIKDLLENDNPNYTIKDFINLLETYPFIVTKQLEAESKDHVNAWSGSDFDATTEVVVYPSKEDVTKKVKCVYVNKNQADILCYMHQILHWETYLMRIICDHKPAGGGDDLFLKDAVNSIMSKTHAKDMDINKWKPTEASAFEKQIMNLFAAIYITSEWIKRSKKKK